MKITILRLGHRVKRDPRLTTHVALTARALGANEIILSGEKDDALLKSIKSVIERWGGTFSVCYEKNWKNVIKTFRGTKVHLTMYGENIQKFNLKKLKKNLLVIVGSEKVPGEVYGSADFNIAVGNQPHSEVAALAIFLDRLTKGKALTKNFHGKIRVVPKARGKQIIKTKT